MFSNPSKDAPVRTLACLGLEGHVETSLKSLLGILQGKIRTVWQYSENVDADVVIYNPHNALAQAMLRRDGVQGTRHIFIPCHSDDPGPDGLTLPLRAERLLYCLELSATKIDGSFQKTLPKRGSLCESVDAALQSREVIAISLSVGSYSGILNPTQKIIHWSHPMVAEAIAQLVLEDVSVQALYASDMDRLRQFENKAAAHTSWDASLWAVGVSTSGGRLLPRLDARKSYRLTRWPDFGLIGRRSTDIKCTALLTHKSMTPRELVTETGFSEARVNGFLNACALCGFLEEAQTSVRSIATSARPVGETSVAGGMLQRIRRALALGTTGA